MASDSPSAAKEFEEVTSEKPTAVNVKRNGKDLQRGLVPPMLVPIRFCTNIYFPTLVYSHADWHEGKAENMRKAKSAKPSEKLGKRLRELAQGLSELPRKRGRPRKSDEVPAPVSNFVAKEENRPTKELPPLDLAEKAKELIRLAKEQGHLTYEDVNDALSEEAVTSDVAPPSTAPEKRVSTGLWTVLVSIVTLLISAILFGWLSMDTHTQPTFDRVTYRRGTVFGARFTLDGNSIVYAATWQRDPVRVCS